MISAKRPGAIFGRNVRKKLLVFPRRLSGHSQSIAHARRELACCLETEVLVQRVPAAEIRFDQRDLLGGKPRGAVAGRRRPASVGHGGLLDRSIVNDHGACGEVAEPLIALGEEDRQHADRVDAGQLVDDPEQVAEDGIEGADRPGLGAKIARALGEAGISVRGVSGLAIGRKFVSYVACDSAEDQAGAIAALKRLK